MKTAVDAGVAQYAQLASVLRHQIAQGEIPAGSRLPTVAELADAHGVARITARQAYGVLAREGLVHSARGRGTFVADAPTQRGAGLDAHLRAAINDPAAAELRIDLIEQQRRQPLPVTCIITSCLNKTGKSRRSLLLTKFQTADECQTIQQRLLRLCRQHLPIDRELHRLTKRSLKIPQRRIKPTDCDHQPPAQ